MPVTQCARHQEILETRRVSSGESFSYVRSIARATRLPYARENLVALLSQFSWTCEVRVRSALHRGALTLDHVLSRGINRAIKKRSRLYVLGVYLGYIIRSVIWEMHYRFFPVYRWLDIRAFADLSHPGDSDHNHYYRHHHYHHLDRDASLQTSRGCSSWD